MKRKADKVTKASANPRATAPKAATKLKGAPNKKVLGDCHNNIDGLGDLHQGKTSLDPASGVTYFVLIAFTN